MLIYDNIYCIFLCIDGYNCYTLWSHISSNKYIYIYIYIYIYGCNNQFCAIKSYKILIFYTAEKWNASRSWDNGLCISYIYIDGLVQGCSNSIANVLELPQSCTTPSMYNRNIYNTQVPRSDFRRPLPQYLRTTYWAVGSKQEWSSKSVQFLYFTAEDINIPCTVTSIH